MRDGRAVIRKSEYTRAYRCISNQKRHDIWQENAEYRQERRRRDFGHESWNWDTNSSDDECTCGCAASNALVPYKDFTKSMGDLRLEDDDSSDESSPRNSAGTRHQPRSRFADKCVSTDDLASLVDRSTQTEQPTKSVKEKKRTPKAISNSLTPHRGDGSRFSYSASWGTLPECAAQQVCSALYVRLNRTQPLCQCSNQFKDPCSKTDYVDEHSIKLISSSDKKKAYNLVKVCEPVMSIRRCKSPQDWQLLALQSTRTGKSHYLVVCRCPTGSSLLGPIKHNNPPYANIPGIRVYGMLCSQRRGNRQVKEKELPPVPWDRLLHLARQSGLTNITLPFS